MVTYLKKIAKQNDTLTYLWGEKSTGKTHLLSAITQAAKQNKLKTIYIDAKHENLDSINHTDIANNHIVCIDNIDAIVANNASELFLFNLFNTMQMQQNKLIVSATTTPNNLPITLKDLQSRLLGEQMFHIHTSFDETELSNIFTITAARYGVNLPEETLKFLLIHFKRDMQTLNYLFAKMCEESLIEQRKLTIPFIRQVLGAGV
ncbi:MAG: hypothetical protein COB50_01485 [Thiotrichales bacterium]|nr:MAG: hypothetical protein COB50_01485 [Thiotrichales bacterium]